MPQKLYSYNLRQMPKIELHRHLDCSVRWSTVNEIAKTLKIDLPLDPEKRKKEFLVTEPMLDLESVLKKFLNTQKLFASKEILERIAFEACEDAYNESTYLVEFRYAPTFIAEGHPQLSFEKIHAAICRGIERAQSTFPMAAGLICILQRIKSYPEVEAVTQFAIDHKDTFLALDLADNEVGFEPKLFAPLFEKAKSAGLHITVHSGEAPHPEAGNWVRDSVEILGAERIGHGVQVIHHPDVIELLKKKDIPLEVCPISNYLTRAFSDHSSHPVRKLMATGLSLTINSDDPGVFASTLTDEYEVLADFHQLGLDDFKQFNQNAYKHSFLPESVKKRFHHLYF